jgi:hypothetical protein
MPFFFNKGTTHFIQSVKEIQRYKELFEKSPARPIITIIIIIMIQQLHSLRLGMSRFIGFFHSTT